MCQGKNGTEGRPRAFGLPATLLLGAALWAAPGSSVDMAATQPGAKDLSVLKEWSASVRAALAQEPLKLGMHAPLTGPLAEMGKEAHIGAQVAVTMLNEVGGVRGRRVELVLFDDQTDLLEGVKGVRRLFLRDKVAGIVSASRILAAGGRSIFCELGRSIQSTRGVAAVAQELKVPYVAAVDPEVAATGKYVFTNSLHPLVQGRAGGRVVAQQLKAKRVALLVVDSDLRRTLAKTFRGEAEALGSAIVAEEGFRVEEKDFRAILARIKAANPDVIYTTGDPEDVSQTIKQARELGIATQLVGTEFLDDPEILLPLVGDLAEGVIVTTALDRDDPLPLMQQFLQRYQAAAGRPAGRVAASTFDAVRMLAHAIAAAGTDPDAIAGALAGLSNFEDAVTGPLLRYTPDGQVIKPVYAQVVRAKAFRRYGVVADPEVITPR